MSLAVAFQTLAAQWQAGSELLLLFDYDGTLAPIVTHPALAELPDPMRRLLEQFRDLPRLRLGIISGRALADVKQMMNMEELIYAGTHGLELVAPGIALVSYEGLQQPDGRSLTGSHVLERAAHGRTIGKGTGGQIPPDLPIRIQAGVQAAVEFQDGIVSERHRSVALFRTQHTQ